MKKIIFLLVLVSSLMLMACEKTGTPAQTDGAKHDFDIQFLFEVEGVKVYRFFDAGDYIYFIRLVVNLGRERRVLITD